MDDASKDLPHPFFATMWEQAPARIDAGLYSEGMSTLISLAHIDPDFLGYTIELNDDGLGIYTCHWKTYDALFVWLEKGKSLLPARLSLDECLIRTGCLWPWLQQNVA